jgi:hypothetical protein
MFGLHSRTRHSDLAYAPIDAQLAAHLNQLQSRAGPSSLLHPVP